MIIVQLLIQWILVFFAVIGVFLFAFGTAAVRSAGTFARIYPGVLREVLVGSPQLASVPAEPGGLSRSRADQNSPTALGHVPELRFVALPGYFHEMAIDDARRVLLTAGGRYLSALRPRDTRAREVLADSTPTLASVAVTGTWAGHIVGGAAGNLVWLLLAFSHLLVTALVLVCANLLGVVLPLLDRAYVSVIRGVGRPPTCRQCGQPVTPRPMYLCPECGCTHREIRPGPYGILRHICRCGTRLPSLPYLAAHRLQAIGPVCGHLLPRRAGAIPETVWSFTGGVGTGKTRLLLSIARHLEELAEETGDRIEELDDTGERLEDIEAAIAATGNTRPTPPAGETSGYTLRLATSHGEHLFHLFDPAGELNYSSARGRAQQHLRQTRTLLLIIDPLAVERFWAQLPPADRQFLYRYRSDARTDRLAFETTCDCLLEMGAGFSHMSLAIVLSRADLLDKTSVADRWRDIDARTWLADSEWLGLGNILRFAELRFREVRLFRTGAVAQDGTTDPSVRELTRWLLRQEGVIFRSPDHG